MKRKLILPLIVSIISAITLLVGVSLAWFSVNEGVHLNTITIRMEGVQGVEFSADGVNYSTTISVDDLMDNGALIPQKIDVVSTAGYVSNGLIQFYMLNDTGSSGSKLTYNSAVMPLIPSIRNGQIAGWVKTDPEVGELNEPMASADVTTGPYVVFDLYVHHFGTQNLILNSGTSVYGDSQIASHIASRVAFVNLGTISGSSYNDDVANLTSLNTSVTAQAKIYEPNALFHAPDAIGDESYAGTSSASGTYDTYYGIKAVKTNIPSMPYSQDDIMNMGVAYIYTEKGVNYTISTDGLEAVNSIYYAGACVTHDTSTYVDELTSTVLTDQYLTSNYTLATFEGAGECYSKLRVYMWLEGQDGDCINQVSGTSIYFDIRFTTIEKVKSK